MIARGKLYYPRVLATPCNEARKYPYILSHGETQVNFLILFIQFIKTSVPTSALPSRIFAPYKNKGVAPILPVRFNAIPYKGWRTFPCKASLPQRSLFNLKICKYVVAIKANKCSEKQRFLLLNIRKR